ncbi:hypothetical protein NE865_04185 [Phthorimaea operculella]|nr:hypothetical protein NE865_04185 [Phthorimaea operculella]
MIRYIAMRYSASVFPQDYIPSRYLLLLASGDNYMHSDDPMIRYIAMRYSASVFPQDYIPSRYLLLLASGDNQDDIATEALKCLYGTSRLSEIVDVVNNVSKKETSAVNLDEDSAKKDKDRESEEKEFKAPKFKDVVNYIWEQMQKRKKGSNAKHRFVIGNNVLQFHPMTYQEILRYMRMCLNRDANLVDCSNHPNATSPALSKYFTDNLLETEVLQEYLTMITTLLNASPESAQTQSFLKFEVNLRYECSNHLNATSPALSKYFTDNLLETEVLQEYLTMITTLLNASPDITALSCFLDIIGCVPQKMAPKYTNLLPFLKNLFTTSTKEDIRETAAVIYAIITVHTSDKTAIEREINEFVVQGKDNKTLEAQCGYITAFANLCERCIVLSKRGKFGGKGFSATSWEPFQKGVICLANFLDHQQTLLVSTSCSAVSILARCSGLPLPNYTPSQENTLKSDTPFKSDKVEQDSDTDDVTKYTVAKRLFGIVDNAKLPSKVKERALYTLGLLCCGERFPFAKEIVKGFMLMAKNNKDFEIHLQIGESLVLCVEGVNSNENRDLWTELPKEGTDKVKDHDAVKENDELLEWLLNELISLSKNPHPHSRQATSIWLLALLKSCPERGPIKNKLQPLQDCFMDLLSENSEIVQDVASKGLSLVYQNSDEGSKQALVNQIIEQLTSGKRSVAQVTSDTKIFEEGQLGKAPTGGNLSTYKELCSLASDLNQPDLLYKFMHLAHHNSMWNSKKGAAFGFHSIALQAGAQLSEHLPKIVPRLYRYRFDPTPRIQNSMTSIWHAIVPNTQHTVHKYHKEILDDLVANLTSPQWRVRMSCCNALSDLLRGAQNLHESLHQLPTIWSQLFRVMDDVHEGTRNAAASCATVLSKLCVRAADANQGKDGKEVVSVILPVLLDSGITNVVKEVRAVSLLTVSKLVTAAGNSLKPFIAKLIPALLEAAGELESAKLSYLSNVVTDSGTRELVDGMRANATRHHYTTDTVVKAMPLVDIENLKEMLPKVLELSKSPQLGTKVACCHFIILCAHYLRADLEPIAGKIMSTMLNGTFDRNATVRKNCSEALGQVSAFAKQQSAEKLMKKLVNLYETKEDDTARSAIALVLKAVSKAKHEHIKDNEAILAPMVFLAMHAPKDEESTTVETFEEIWTDISPSREYGIRTHLPALRNEIENALNSSSWTKKVQAANAIKTICKEMSSGLGDQREQFIRALLAAVHGKTFDGKQYVIEALAELCAVKDGETPVSPSISSEVIKALLVEARKQEMVYKKHAITALGEALAATNCDRFNEVYDIVKVILSKDDIDKDSDDEDNEGARQRREQLLKLKEAAYELLGKAWPKQPDTQEKYQDVFFGHCSQAYSNSSRSTQLAILTSMTRVLERLVVLKDEPMETDNSDRSGRDKAISSVTTQVADVIEYTLKNSNQVRHRRDALNLLEILVKRLKELNKTEELEKLKTIYSTYAQDLSKDASHEIRTKVDNIKVILK